MIHRIFYKSEVKEKHDKKGYGRDKDKFRGRKHLTCQDFTDAREADRLA